MGPGGLYGIKALCGHNGLLPPTPNMAAALFPQPEVPPHCFPRKWTHRWTLGVRGGH